MLLPRLRGAVRKTPLGTSSVPPPASLSAAIALRNAALLSVAPSPRALYGESVMSMTVGWSRPPDVRASGKGRSESAGLVRWNRSRRWAPARARAGVAGRIAQVVRSGAAPSTARRRRPLLAWAENNNVILLALLAGAGHGR